MPRSGADADSAFQALSGCPPESLLDLLGDRASSVLLQGTADLDGTAVSVWVVALPDGEQLVPSTARAASSSTSLSAEGGSR